MPKFRIPDSFVEMVNLRSLAKKRADKKPRRLPHSLYDFLEQKDALRLTQHTDLVVVFGYWLSHKKNYKSFNVKDIGKCYAELGLQTPENISKYIIPNTVHGGKRRMWFERADNKKDNLVAWTITSLGTKYVQTARCIGSRFY